MAMGKRRNNEAMLLGVLVLLLFLDIHCEAKNYTVQWNSKAALWAEGKKFQADDLIVFKYKPRSETVAVVDADGYTACKAKEDSKVYTSGYDGATLEKGSNYFISTLQGSCQGGVKLNITTA